MVEEMAAEIDFEQMIFALEQQRLLLSDLGTWIVAGIAAIIALLLLMGLFLILAKR